MQKRKVLSSPCFNFQNRFIKKDTSPDVLGIDIGENNIAAFSEPIKGQCLVSGRKQRHERKNFENLRARLQAHGTQSALQRLREVSGREKRRTLDFLRCLAKKIVLGATALGKNVIAMENLTGILDSFDNKRKETRSRLHRWAYSRLRQCIGNKAEKHCIKIVFVNPAYTSQTCSHCGEKGKRNGSLFDCKSCGRIAHADLNASENIAILAAPATGPVNARNVRPQFCG